MSTAEHAGQLIASQDGLEVIQCVRCGWAHLKGGGRGIADYEAGRCQGEAWRAKEDWEMGLGLWDPFFSFQLDLLREDQPILDVGAGFGHFVRFARARGVAIEGTEVSRLALQACPFLKRPEEVTGRFGSLRLSLVLEHIPDPVSFLVDLVERHRPRLVLVIVPHEGNPLQRAVGGAWWVSPWHWNYFDRPGLEACLQAAGLRVLRWGATFPMERFIQMGLDYRGDPARGRIAHLLRLCCEVYLPEAFTDLYPRWLEEQGLGRELIALAEVVR